MWLSFTNPFPRFDWRRQETWSNTISWTVLVPSWIMGTNNSPTNWVHISNQLTQGCTYILSWELSHIPYQSLPAFWDTSPSSLRAGYLKMMGPGKDGSLPAWNLPSFWYCWWFRNPANQLSLVDLVVYPINFNVLYIPGGDRPMSFINSINSLDFCYFFWGG